MSALWEHAVDDSMLVPWHRANASRSADGWELVAVTSATGARYERYFWKRPGRGGAEPSDPARLPGARDGGVVTHPDDLNLDSDEAEAVLDAAEAAASNPATYGCTPNECATTPSRHCCIPCGKEGVIAALNDLGVVLRWETPADRTAFLALTRGDDR